MKLYYLLLIPIIAISSFQQPGFKTAQLKSIRVKEAYQEKESTVKTLFKAKNLDVSQTDLFIRAFKQERIVEVWGKDAKQSTYQLITTYPVCAASGILGPKRYGGDLQVPEGFYYIDRFNPQSNFHLSLGINYPNDSDRKLGKKGNLGGDIFIHGDCVTIGCLPLTDNKIKELYIMAIEAKAHGQGRIPVHIFPARLTDSNFNGLKKQFVSAPLLIGFWRQLKTGYDLFENARQLPTISVDATGAYVCK